MKCILVIISLFVAQNLLAKTWYLPMTTPENKYQDLAIINYSDEASYVELYIKSPEENDVLVRKYPLKIAETLFIKLGDLSEPNERAWIKSSVLSPEGAIELRIINQNDYSSPAGKLAHLWTYQLADGEEQYHVQSHSHLTNHVEIMFLDKQNKQIAHSKKTLDAFEELVIRSQPAGAHRVKITTQRRSHAYASSPVRYYKSFVPTSIQGFKPEKNKAYFLVETTEANLGKSFMLELTDELLIAQAREAVREPNNEMIPRIITGQVIANPRNTNLSWKADIQSAWSWTLKNIEFVGVGMIQCDINPQLVEERLGHLLAQSARICPWRYRITKEWKP